MTSTTPLARSEAFGLKLDLLEASTHLRGGVPVGSDLEIAQDAALGEVRDALAAARLMLGDDASDAAAVALTDVILRRLDFVVARWPVDLGAD